MITKYTREYAEEGLAIKHITIHFFGIKIKEELITTTNSNVIYQLTPRVSKPKVNGFINNK